MPRALKVLVWILVFGACAGVGAYVAAHSNPFPPGVEDPGARSTSSVPPQSNVAERWAGSLKGGGMHSLYFGGTCATDWGGNIRLSVDDSAGVHGEITVKLASDPSPCSFPQAQVQSRAVLLRVAGRRSEGVLDLALTETARRPAGSQDLGGMFPLRQLRITSSPVDEARSHPLSRFHRTLRRSDGDRGTYAQTLDLHLRCVSGCG